MQESGTGSSPVIRTSRMWRNWQTRLSIMRFVFIESNCSEHKATHMRTGEAPALFYKAKPIPYRAGLVRAAPHKEPVPKCFVLSSNYDLLWTERPVRS